MASLPEGTITYMLTDLQGSTRAWERAPNAMRSAMARHDAILAAAMRDHAGHLVEAGREGDSVLAAFVTAAAAAACALEIQRDFAAESWPEGLELRVRIALNTGEAQLRDDHYFGPALNRCARLLATGHPGQILLTKATEEMLADELPTDAKLEDLGLHRLKDLSRPEQVFQLTDLAHPTEFPPIASLTPRLTNVPRYLTSFVGRRAELSALRSVLRTSRMVTLTGAAGSGKTRLAAEFGRVYLNHWPGGVWWVELAPVSDPLQMAGAVVRALDLPGRGPALDVSTAWLAGRRAVVVLDNCEHLVTTCAEYCSAALERCPELTIIATSREPLMVAGEAHWPLSSMSDTDSARLFETRARLVVPGFKLTPDNVDAVTQICAHLDGMPLAIELAAARVGMMTEQEMLGQLADRFHLLVGGSRTVPERLRSMLATIDWSYRLFTQDEASLFRRLAVFRGGFTLEGAQAVCGEGLRGGMLDVLSGLVQKSMVVAERTADAGTRYRLLESQLAFAEERLRETGELELTRRRHYEYFLERAAAMRPWRVGRPTRNPTSGLARAIWNAEEWANLLAALAWARNNVDDLGLSLAVDCLFRDTAQARSLFADLLAHSPTRGTVRVEGLVDAANLALAQGDYEAALDAAERGVALARELAQVDWLALAVRCLGDVYEVRGELDAAAEIYDEAISLLRGSTNLRELALMKHSVGLLAVDRGDYLRAREILAECVAFARAERMVASTAMYLGSLAMAQLGLNDNQAAAASWKESLSIQRRLNNSGGTMGSGPAISLLSLAVAASAGGDDQRALRLCASASRLSGEQSTYPEPWLRKHAEAAERHSRSRLGPRRSEVAWSQGLAMSVNQAIDYALGESEPETWAVKHGR